MNLGSPNGIGRPADRPRVAEMFVVLMIPKTT